MRFHIKILAIVVFTLLSFSGWAQRGYGTLTYSIALPMGKTSDFIENTSFRGVGLDYNYFLISNFSLGASVGWNVFNQEIGRVTETYGDITYTGQRFNYFNAVPIIALPRYYFIPLNEGSFSLYGGVGLGAIFARQTFDLGGLRSETDEWQFAIGPE
ncbi:MAG: outer membrane beta-barrel protein, partial [Bacteroidota bacterium]|nr:outer membrane beta-barrel protein [Bacteroidota bacterium]